MKAPRHPVQTFGFVAVSFSASNAASFALMRFTSASIWSAIWRRMGAIFSAAESSMTLYSPDVFSAITGNVSITVDVVRHPSMLCDALIVYDAVKDAGCPGTAELLTVTFPVVSDVAGLSATAGMKRMLPYGMPVPMLVSGIIKSFFAMGSFLSCGNGAAALSVQRAVQLVGQIVIGSSGHAILSSGQHKRQYMTFPACPPTYSMLGGARRYHCASRFLVWIRD